MSRLLPHPIYILLLHCICVTPPRAPRGENDLFLKQFTQHEIMFDMLTFVRSAIHHHSPLLVPLLFTGQLGQHQHHPAVLPWSPPAVSRGIAPGGWAGGPAGVQSSRWVGGYMWDTRDTEGNEILGIWRCCFCHGFMSKSWHFSVFLRFMVCGWQPRRGCTPLTISSKSKMIKTSLLPVLNHLKYEPMIFYIFLVVKKLKKKKSMKRPK